MKIVIVKCDGTMTELDWEPRIPLTEYYGDDITFVGQKSSDIVAVGKKNMMNEKSNTFVERYSDMFEKETRGDILLIGTDVGGNELDLDIEMINKELVNIEK